MKLFASADSDFTCIYLHIHFAGRLDDTLCSLRSNLLVEIIVCSQFRGSVQSAVKRGSVCAPVRPPLHQNHPSFHLGGGARLALVTSSTPVTGDWRAAAGRFRCHNPAPLGANTATALRTILHMPGKSTALTSGAARSSSGGRGVKLPPKLAVDGPYACA